MPLVLASLLSTPERVVLSDPCMDPEPANGSHSEPPPPEASGIETLDLAGPALLLIGFSLALATVGVPVVAVITDRPSGSVTTTIAEDRDGSSLPSSLAIAGSRQPGR
ncbi:MAG: hypothetical protein ACON4T_01195 [Synechococcus sp.]